MSPGPRNPFQDWPIQAATSGLYAWYTEPAVFVSQVVVERATLRDAEDVARLVDQVLRVKKPDIQSAGGLLIAHDWRALKAYDADARAFLMERVRSHKPGLIREMVIAIDTSPLFRLAIGAANAYMVLATGRSIRTVHAIAPELIRYGIRKPADGSRFPGAVSSIRPPRPLA